MEQSESWLRTWVIKCLDNIVQNLMLFTTRHRESVALDDGIMQQPNDPVGTGVRRRETAHYLRPSRVSLGLTPR